MDLGDRIQRAWRSFVRQQVSADGLRRVIDEIEWDKLGDYDTLYFYVVFARDLTVGEPYVDEFDGPTAPDYFRGASSEKLVVSIPAHQGMTKQDLLEVDAAQASDFWDHPDWSDG